MKDLTKGEMEGKGLAKQALKIKTYIHNINLALVEFKLLNKDAAGAYELRSGRTWEDTLEELRTLMYRKSVQGIMDLTVVECDVSPQHP